MRFGGIQRTAAEIAGQPDTVDDMPRRPLGKQQAGQLGARYRMHDVILALQPGNERRSDEATGADDGK